MCFCAVFSHCVMWFKVVLMTAEGLVFERNSLFVWAVFEFFLFVLSAEENMALLVVGALLCLSFWVSFYFILCNVNGSRSYEWNCRLVTLVHGILAVCITAYIGYVDGPWPFTYPGKDWSLHNSKGCHSDAIHALEVQHLKLAFQIILWMLLWSLSSH